MIDILINWLKTSMGIILDVEKLGNELKDGTVFIKIFEHYLVIKPKLVKYILPTDDEAICRYNLVQQKIWFKLLDIDFNDNIIDKIIKCDFSTCIHVLYQMFETLENKNSVNFLTKQKERFLKNYDKKFNITEVSLLDIHTKTNKSTDTIKYSSRISKNKSIINWYENKYGYEKKNGVYHKGVSKSLKSYTRTGGSTIDKINEGVNINKSVGVLLQPEKKLMVEKDILYVRNELHKFSSSSDFITDENIDHTGHRGNNIKLPSFSNSRTHSRSKFMNSYQYHTDIYYKSPFLPPISAKPNVKSVIVNDTDYMNKLKCNIAMSFKIREETYKFSNLVINEVWKMFLKNEEEDIKRIISFRLIKQPFFERELCTKFFQIINQNEIQKQSYIELEKCVAGNSVLTSSDINVGFTCSNKDANCLLDDSVAYYLSEKKRTVQLHKRLYAEKLKSQFEKQYAICLQTISDICDLAVKKSDYESKYGLPLPSRMWSEWKCLFYNEQPIFGLGDNIEKLNILFSREENNSDISVEVDRQSVLHESDLDDYLYLQQEWADLLHCDESSSPHTYCDLLGNQLVLGYIIHRLLDIKYPVVPQPKPADILKYSVRAVVNGLESEELIMELKNFLIKSDIMVIDVKSVVHFCMQCYKDSIKLRNEEFSEYILSCDLLKYKETNSKPLQRTSEQILSEVSGDDIHTKYTQTDISLLEVDDLISVSKGAKLGAEILNILLSGNELPSSILVDAIIEYIKNNENNIKGWVIVNFPSTLLQASIIEYVLSSKNFPFNLDEETNSVYSGVTALSVRDNDTLTNKEYEERSRNIVPNPRKLDYDDTFKTYFSLFLTVIKGETTTSSSLEDTTLESKTLDSESTTLLEHPEKEGIPTIHTFYQEQDISYDFIYETFDLNTLKQLAHVILSHNLEDSAKQRTSSEIFGENVVGMFSESVDAEVAHDSAYKHESPVKIIKNKAGILGFTSHEVTANEPSLHLESVKDDKPSSPGDKDWVFADFPISDNIMVSLASFWEGLVNNYISNLIDAFFVKRNNDYMLIPYITYITLVMEECFNKEDVRQSIVTEFLRKYNDIHPLLRSDLEMICELHLRVEELKTQLTALCEEKRNNAEKMRQTILNQNWFSVEFIVIANCFISLLQTEMDRCIYTLELIRDYYMSMLENYESKSLNNVMLNRIKLNYEEIQQNDLRSIIVKRVLNNDKLESVNPVYELIEKEAKTVCSEVEKFQSLFEDIIVKEEANAMKNHKKYVAQKKDEKKGIEKLLKGSVNKMKSEDNNKNGSTPNINEVEQENFEEMGKRLENLFLEWNCAVKNETDRTLMRVKLIMLKAYQDLTNIETVMKDTFDNFYKTLTTKFNEECKCIDQLCEIFHVAIEENIQINADFYFNQDNFYVERRYLMKVAPVLKLPTALDEMLLEDSFTIKQLEAIKERLVHVAPNGVISQSAFVTVIQNMILPGSENGGFKSMPKIWNQLQPKDCVELFIRIFGNVGLLEWKDFLILCLDLPFPVMEDIVDAKLQFLRYDSFETDIVTYDDYMNVTLWFQRELPESPLNALHIILAKEFLFSLYKVNENSINYMALLLGFCRDKDVKVGFGKGLSLLYGRCVVIYKEDLSLEQILTDHINTEIKIVNSLIDDLLSDVVTVASVTDKNNVYDTDDDNDNNDDDDDDDLRSVYSVDFADDVDPTLEEHMYDQFFRRHVVLQWCSSVPYTLIITLLSNSFCPVFFPNIAHETCFVAFKELRDYVSAIDCIEETVFVPSFMQNWWLELVLKYIHKFTAFEVTKIVEDIVKKRK